MSILLTRLMKEKALLSNQIEDLKRQLNAVEKLIIKEKAVNAAQENSESVNKKNISRIIAETMILEEIKKSKNGLETKEVISQLKKIGYALNPNTVRTHLSRMRDKGLLFKKQNKWKKLPQRQKDLLF